MNGVGGRTIAEAKESMTQSEAIQWSVYLRKRGSLHTGRRLEIGFAHVLDAIYKALGQKDLSPRDFMPHEFPRDVEPERVATFAEVVGMLQSTTRH